jgi:dienelactone hydrolase
MWKIHNPLAICLGIWMGIGCGTEVADAADSTSNTLTIASVSPKRIDIRVNRFLAPNYVAYPDRHGFEKLVVFFPGTGGIPSNSAELLEHIAHRGYGVIGLEYDSVPGVAQICSTDPDGSCSGKVREKRIYGTDVTGAIDDSRNEAVVFRLTGLLKYMARMDRRWKRFLRNDMPDWTRITVCGFSQGAGVAAYIAKRTAVTRIVLLSGPWDSTSEAVAPWLTQDSATPPDRWFAAYHEREPMAPVIKRVYRALDIPDTQISVFRGGPALMEGERVSVHASVINVRAFAGQWDSLFPSTDH